MVGTGVSAAAGWAQPLALWPIVAIVIGALVLDVVHFRTGRVRPLALHRQVPREWGRLLPPSTVAALYGGRLGVGPFTMLTTWLWWAAMIGASSIGVWAAVATSALFAMVRVVVNDVAATQIRTGGLPVVDRLATMTRRSWITIDGTTVLGLAVLVLVASGCVAGGDVAVEGTTQTPVSQIDDGEAANDLLADGEASEPSTRTGGDVSEGSAEESMTEPEVDDASDDGASAAESGDDERFWQPSTPDELSAALLPEVQWFTRLTDTGADQYLDIDAAAQRQPDPTEEGPLLETRGFLGGWSRVFRNDTQDVVVAQMYEFRTATDAAFYLEDGFITLTGYGVQLFDIESLVGVRGFRQDGEDEIGPIVNFGLAYADENRWYLLTLTGDPETATLDILVSAMEAQRALDRE